MLSSFNFHASLNILYILSLWSNGNPSLVILASHFLLSLPPLAPPPCYLGNPIMTCQPQTRQHPTLPKLIRQTQSHEPPQSSKGWNQHFLTLEVERFKFYWVGSHRADPPLQSCPTPTWHNCQRHEMCSIIYFWWLYPFFSLGRSKVRNLCESLSSPTFLFLSPFGRSGLEDHDWTVGLGIDFPDCVSETTEDDTLLHHLPI